VVGLVEETNSKEPGWSSAYLIDRGLCAVLTRKGQDDGSGNYRPCTENFDQGLLHRGIWITALICMDAARFSLTNQRHKAILVEIEARAALTPDHAMLCVPSCMQTYGSRDVAKDWPKHLTVILANSGRAQPSVIRLSGQSADTEPFSFKQHHSAVCIESLFADDPPV
jgi:hypothetical protein